MGMTLWSVKMYGYNCRKIKSYQIQREFFLLFIFLGYQVIPSDRMLLSLSHTIFLHAFKLFERFYSICCAIEFFRNLDAICIAKALDQNPF